MNSNCKQIYPIKILNEKKKCKNSKGERPWEGTLALWGGGIVTGRHDASPGF